MRTRSFRPLLALGLLPACAPSISVEVLQPALVTMPAEVHTFAVVDRSKASNVGQGILGTLEGDTAAELSASRDGTTLYAGVRGSDTIGVLSVRGAGEALQKLCGARAGSGDGGRPCCTCRRRCCCR